MNRGHTLFEILTVLVILGIAGTALLERARAQADRLAVRAAREEAVALFHRARMEARLRGEARVRIVEGEGVGLVVASGDGSAEPPESGAGWESAARVDPRERGVDLTISGDRTEVEIRFDARGLARFASATLELERGRARTELVVSAHGRVRR